MVYLKTYKEIDLMRESSSLVAKTHAELAKIIKPGINLLRLDKLAEEFIGDHGGVPAFKGYNGFPCTFLFKMGKSARILSIFNIKIIFTTKVLLV